MKRRDTSKFLLFLFKLLKHYMKKLEKLFKTKDVCLSDGIMSQIMGGERMLTGGSWDRQMTGDVTTSTHDVNSYHYDDENNLLSSDIGPVRCLNEDEPPCDGIINMGDAVFASTSQNSSLT